MKTGTRNLVLPALAGVCLVSAVAYAAEARIVGKWRCDPVVQDVRENNRRALGEPASGIQAGSGIVLTGRVEIEGGGHLPVAAGALTAGEQDSPALLRFQALRVDGTAGPAPEVRSDGVFVFALPAGEYRIDAILLPFFYSVKAMSYGSVDLLRSPLKITEAPSSEIHVTLAVAPADSVPSGVTVTGSIASLPTAGPSRPMWVSLEASSPVPDLLARALGIAEQHVGEAPLRADGTFEFRKVPPGTYTVRTLPINMLGQAITRIVVTDRDLNLLSLAPTPPRGGGAAGGGPRGGGAGGRGGGATTWSGKPPALPSSTLGPPVTMDLKLDKDNHLTGSITFLRPTARVSFQQGDYFSTTTFNVDQKYKIEKGTSTGRTFTFQTYEKIDNRQIATTWKGELTDDATLVAIRLQGEPPVLPGIPRLILLPGPDAFLFHRTK